MKLYKTFGMHTDHDYYGHPVETSRVEIRISDDVKWTPEVLAELERAAEERLHSAAKRMPHRYWQGRKS